MSRLLEDMAELVSDIRDHLIGPDNKPNTHEYLCELIATSHDLHTKHQGFPIWLSRVVEGVMADGEHSDEI